MYLRQRCFDSWVSNTILKLRVAAASGHANMYTLDFRRRKIPCSSAYTIAEKAIQFRHLDYNPDRAQKLISACMSRHLSTRNISSKSMHAFLSNLANRQIDRQTVRQTNTGKNISSFVGGNYHAVTCWNKKLSHHWQTMHQLHTQSSNIISPHRRH